MVLGTITWRSVVFKVLSLKINQFSIYTFLIVEIIPKFRRFLVMIGSSPHSNFGSSERLRSFGKHT
uniref:Transmembrane protein n=1 Tax=Medicago truncatula TaxID=3880 RepID=I3SCJ4_MEDTR|nr:unknown [Medicago truncatula]